MSEVKKPYTLDKNFPLRKSSGGTELLSIKISLLRVRVIAVTGLATTYTGTL